MKKSRVIGVYWVKSGFSELYKRPRVSTSLKGKDDLYLLFDVENLRHPTVEPLYLSTESFFLCDSHRFSGLPSLKQKPLSYLDGVVVNGFWTR